MTKQRLCDSLIRTSKATTKDLRLFDGNGLYLLVKPNDSKWWRLDYSINSKRKTISLGTYPVTTLADARKKTYEVKKLVASGIDPAEERRSAKTEASKLQEENKRSSLGLPSVDSFKDVADEWYEKKMHHMAESYKGRVYSRLARDIFPYLGSKNIAEITPQELLRTIQKIEERGANESAHRTLRTCSQIFRFGIVTGRLNIDVADTLKEALVPVKGKHFSAITDVEQLKFLLKSIDVFQGSLVVRAAFELMSEYQSGHVPCQ